jgi:organic hydroperoxide reductase OsmC/OhrA
MSEHRARISWKKSKGEFTRGKFSLEHTCSFDGGATIPASASPSVVPPPYSNATAIDPEEAFVAAISSCHMLTFLYVASRQGYEVESYEDEAIGVMSKDANGVAWVSSVTLKPTIAYGDRIPSRDEVDRLHHAAHAGCFIANSVKTAIKVNQQ